MKIRCLSLAVVAAALSGGAFASPVFEGRAANGSVDLSCSAHASATSSKCVMFYNKTLNITILNNWSIGAGAWDSSASPGSAQGIAEQAGFDATGLTGWALPTMGGFWGGGENQFLSIWNAVGGTLEGMQAQFDGVLASVYWSSSDYAPGYARNWNFGFNSGGVNLDNKSNRFYAVAVRAGDVVQAVPEPEGIVLVLSGLGLLAATTRRKYS